MSAARISSPSARAALAALVDGFERLEGCSTTSDPLAWPGYRDGLRRAGEASSQDEAALVGHGRVDGVPVVAIALDFRFMGGSMGAATGARIVRAFEVARDSRRAVVSLIASGGARMQEGMCSLVQMQRVAAAAAAARDAGIPHIAVLRNPTTGGVWAALGSGADVIFALPGATVAFAGRRVRGDANGPSAEFTAAGQQRHGAVDHVLAEDELRRQVALAVSLLDPSGRGEPRPADVPAALGGADDAEAESAWAHVLRSRRRQRPRAARYLDAYFELRLPISGDRAGGVDPEMLCGFGRRAGRTIAYAAQAGGRNAPAGFRAASRLLDLAAALRLPVLTLIDTPGAANDAAAERSGVGTAIGELFNRVATSPVPVTSLVIGEGGSGGALALASHDALWMVPAAYFAAIAPEGAAAILARDERRAPELAERMRLRPDDLLQLGIIQGIAPVDPRLPSDVDGRSGAERDTE